MVKNFVIDTIISVVVVVVVIVVVRWCLEPP